MMNENCVLVNVYYEPWEPAYNMNIHVVECRPPSIKKLEKISSKIREIGILFNFSSP